MGVATLITVMTIVQGANLYVEKKIANLGTDVFQVARTPFAATDFNVVIRALKNKHIELEDLKAVQEIAWPAKQVGATGSTTGKVRYGDNELADVNIYGHTPNMVDIDTRTVLQGRYFTESENDRSAPRLPDRRQPRPEVFSGRRSARQSQSALGTKSSR